MKTPHRPGAEAPATVQPAAARCHPPIGSPLRRCAGRSRTQLLVGLSLLAAAGTAWIPTPPLQMRLPASPSAAPDLPAAQNPSPASDLPRLTRA